MQSEIKNCQNCKNEFVIEPDDFAFYKKIKVPPPTWCPECRLQRRLAWINPRTLYSRKVGAKSVISMYAQDKQYNIIEDRDWWGNAFDSTEYGKAYDFTMPFFKQFGGLLRKAPLPHLQRNYLTFENSDYCNAASYLKNCFLVFGADECENVAYSNGVVKVKDSLEVTFTEKSELCYECFAISQCYRCFFCRDIENCQDMIFSQDCIGCSNCIGCFGLRNKSYHIFNKPYSKEAYKQKREELNLGSFEGLEKLRKEAESFFILQPRKFMHGRSNNNVSGDYIYHSKNTHHAFKAIETENSKYVFILDYFNGGTADAYDYSWFGCGAELMYEAAWCGLQSSNIRFSFWNYNATDLQYCFACPNSQSLFGCVGLNNKKYCILNKQYTKEEYEELVPKIIQHMSAMPYTDAKGRIYKYGEFFPIELSPFDYNETLASEFLPKPRNEIEASGYSWKDRAERSLVPDMSWKDLPDRISDAKDDLLGKLILCRAFEENKARASEHNCTKVFKLIPQEIALYRRFGLPLPRFCANSRHYQRMGHNSLKLYHRQCMCAKPHQHHELRCSNTFETPYAPDRPEIVYCEPCYQAEVV